MRVSSIEGQRRYVVQPMSSISVWPSPSSSLSTVDNQTAYPISLVITLQEHQPSICIQVLTDDGAAQGETSSAEAINTPATSDCASKPEDEPATSAAPATQSEPLMATTTLIPLKFIAFLFYAVVLGLGLLYTSQTCYDYSLLWFCALSVALSPIFAALWGTICELLKSLLSPFKTSPERRQVIKGKGNGWMEVLKSWMELKIEGWKEDEALRREKKKWAQEEAQRREKGEWEAKQERIQKEWEEEQRQKKEAWEMKQERIQKEWEAEEARKTEKWKAESERWRRWEEQQLRKEAGTRNY
ncbi:hypothetical protein KEM55_005311 [Ascosphaera atra]|nr:hypothetical protein KEM55_005311 [Ascosphaera atra]